MRPLCGSRLGANARVPVVKGVAHRWLAVCWNRSVMNTNEPYRKDTHELEKQQNKDLNRDPITGEPGSHPVGTGVGSAGGAAAGAAIGAAGGPVGMAVGGVVGAIAGGLAGHAVAEGIDPTAENAYWSENYRNEPYYRDEYDYDDYEPAYRAGYTSYGAGGGDNFDETEARLAGDWEDRRGKSRLEWDEARHAARAGWHRVQRSQPSPNPMGQPVSRP